MLDEITPVVLTFDEEANIARCLERLRWARRVVVIDSGSTDRTIEIARTFENVVVVEHVFEGFAAQWNFALERPEIETEWILALDADFMVSEELVNEMRSLSPGPAIDGYRVRFTYSILGRPLRASLYPPLVVLFRRSRVHIVQQGHNQVASVDGKEQPLKHRIVHDDRKILTRWLQNQARYMDEEADKLLNAHAGELSLADRVRKLRVIAPLAVPLYLLFVKGLILDGRAGLYYALQRAAAESILALTLFERPKRSKRRPGDSGSR